MSHFATPFIVVNLGCEMVYVIHQRLKAQNISLDKADRVLTDIATILLHPKLLDELFLPQPVTTHQVIRDLLQGIATMSIMKLDDYSLSKLWDLMTMIFKWQLSVTTNQNIFDITHRHLKCTATLLPQNLLVEVIENAQQKFETLHHRFTDVDYKSLSSTMILWFSEYHSKISVLLRLGLQKKDGTFSAPSSIPPKFLINVGENIYNYDIKKDLQEYENRCTNTNEISCLLAAQIEHMPRKLSVELQLPITFGNECTQRKTLRIVRDTQFESINTNIIIKNTDLNYTPNFPKSLQEDLLDMMDNE